MHKNKALSGIKRLEVIKSRKSKIDLFKIVKLLRVPNESVAGIARKETIQNSITLALILEILSLSTIEAIGTSIMLMPDVIAAASKSVKKAAETTSPHGICENM